MPVKSNDIPICTLIVAGEYDHVKQLLESPNALDRCGLFTLLYIAVLHNQVEIARLLLESKADMNEKASAPENPFFMAVHKGNSTMIELFIEHGANPNEHSSNGTPLLIYAIQIRNAQVVRLLLKAGADYLSEDKSGKNAFDYAMNLKDSSINGEIKKIILNIAQCHKNNIDCFALINKELISSQCSFFSKLSRDVLLHVLQPRLISAQFLDDEEPKKSQTM